MRHRALRYPNCMDRTTIWNLAMGAIAIVLGLAIIDRSPLAAACLVVYGLIEWLTEVSDRWATLAEDRPGVESLVKLALLLVALVAVFF